MPAQARRVRVETRRRDDLLILPRGDLLGDSAVGQTAQTLADAQRKVIFDGDKTDIEQTVEGGREAHAVGRVGAADGSTGGAKLFNLPQSYGRPCDPTHIRAVFSSHPRHPAATIQIGNIILKYFPAECLSGTGGPGLIRFHSSPARRMSRQVRLRLDRIANRCPAAGKFLRRPITLFPAARFGFGSEGYQT